MDDDVAVFAADVWFEDRTWQLQVDGVVHLRGPDPQDLRHEARAIIALFFEVDITEISITTRRLHP